MAILSNKSFDIVNQNTRRQKGPLVKVQIAPGQYVKMYTADAIAAGHLPPEKAAPPKEDKLRPPQGDKARPATDDKRVSAETGGEPPSTTSEKASPSGQQGDDLTTIPGLGRATARLLETRGITTLEQLRMADISYLGAAARAAIEKWREG